MKTGKVKWFNNEKGYGFIAGEDGKDIFIHHSHIDMEGFRTLESGQSVSYDIGENDRGRCAMNVKVIA